MPDLIKAGHSDTYVFAKDEAVISDCNSQIEQIPEDNNTDKTYIFVSAGGNNILNNILWMDFLECVFWNFQCILQIQKQHSPNHRIILKKLYLNFQLGT